MTWTEVFPSGSGEVFALFLIPIGGGIPAGVILAKTHAILWPTMALLYFLSDLVLAVTFEPLMHVFFYFAKRSPFLRRWAETYRKLMEKSGVKYSRTSGPFALVALSFGVDPMTGRAASRAIGHGFFAGWAMAICGDMIFFTLIMASTLWLDNILGDGTLTAIIIMAGMIGVPILIERWKAKRAKSG